MDVEFKYFLMEIDTMGYMLMESHKVMVYIAGRMERSIKDNLKMA